MGSAEEVKPDTKRQKEMEPAVIIIESADIDEATEPIDLDAGDDEMDGEIVEQSDHIHENYPDPDATVSEDEELDEPLIEQADQELPDIEDQPVPDSSVQFTR